MTEVWSVDDPAQIGLCGGRTLVRTRRQFEHVSGPKKGQRSKVETVYHVSSVPIDEGHGVEYFADAVRGQWAIESKYHARRDWAYCEDVRTRRCNENVTGAMLLARSPVFVFLAQSDMENCQAFKEEVQSDRNRVFRLVTAGQAHRHRAESRFGHLMAEWTRTPHGDAHTLRQNPKRRPC